MPAIKFIQKIRNYIKKVPIFNSRDIERIIKDKNYTHLILHKLEKREEIFRVKRGYYSVFRDPIFSVFCFKPAYLGLYEALSLYNFWEQETNVIIITSRKVRTGTRKIFDSNVIIKKINPELMFGIDYLKYDNFYLPVSDFEKTLLDFFYFREYLPKDVLKKIKSKIDNKKIKQYLKKYSPEFRLRFLNTVKV